MKKISILICIVLLVFITGCNEKKERTLKYVLDSKNYIVVDVREDYEYLEGHVVDSINIPYTKIDKDINLDKNKTILVYCKSGKRSKIAYDKLKELNYDVIDLGAYDKVTLDKE